MKIKIPCLFWNGGDSVHFQLNDAFTLYKKEKAENDRMQNETIDRLQKQLTELRSSRAKLTSQLEFSNKRCVKSMNFLSIIFPCCCEILILFTCLSGMRFSKRLCQRTAERFLPYRIGTKKWRQQLKDTSTSSTLWARTWDRLMRNWL